MLLTLLASDGTILAALAGGLVVLAVWCLWPRKPRTGQ